MNFSLLIPSKGDPWAAAVAVLNPHSLAAQPLEVEYILVIDSTASVKENWQYESMIGNLRQLGIHASLVQSSTHGYTGTQKMYCEAYDHAEGNYSWVWNTDARVLTPHWDAIYMKALAWDSCGVAGCHNDESPNPHAYPWAFPVITRSLSRAIGDRLINYGSFGPIDRVVDAYARLTHRGVIANVHTRHFFDMTYKPGTSRQAHYDELRARWNPLQAEWESCVWDMNAKVNEIEAWKGAI